MHFCKSANRNGRAVRRRPMAELEYNDADIAGILERTETIVMVGASGNWVRPSHFAMKYLQSKGYRVIPVNPGEAGSTLLGETVYGDLAAIPDDFQAPIIDGAGVIRVRDETSGEYTALGQLQIVDFPEIYDRNAAAQTPYQTPLKKSKEGLFIPHAATPQVPAEGFEISQGFLEESNVEPVLEMVKMIDIFRSYEAEQRAIQVQDSTLERSVNDLGRVV